MTDAARYDAIADWYDRYIRDDKSGFASMVQELLAQLLGRGHGSCLDVGRGTGISIPTIARLGWRVTGVDVSSAQLELARANAGEHAHELVRASADALPFGDSSFDAAAFVLVHTDIDQPRTALRELARTLAPGAVVAFICVHPCFEGGHVEKLDDGTRRLHAGYLEAGWAATHRFSDTGVRTRVGVHHLPLAELLNAVIGAGFRIDHVTEDSLGDIPSVLGIRALRVERSQQ